MGSFVGAQRLDKHRSLDVTIPLESGEAINTRPALLLVVPLLATSPLPTVMKKRSSVQNLADMDRSVYIPLCICLISFAVLAYSPYSH